MKLTKKQADFVSWRTWMQSAESAADPKALRREAGTWLKELRDRAGLSQLDLAHMLGLKYYTFISQVENGFGRVPIESMEAWAQALGVDASDFARKLVAWYDPELYRLLFKGKK
jgi:DNA-binding XRE family transcriptional regulator